MGARRWLAVLVGGGVALACGGGWDVEALEARYPSLAAAGSHRLGDATPYLLPLDDELTLFLCRWRAEFPLRVALPSAATPAERALLERALSAWESAVAGLAFERVASASDAEIEIHFGTPDSRRSAETGADCAVDLEVAWGGAVLAAHLVAAHVALRRSETDWRGREIALNEEELLGSALHEMGHALGFQGHARRGRTIMVRSVDDVRLAARRLLAGEPFRDAAVAALYRVPSGSVVGRRALPAGRTDPLDRLRSTARAIRLAGPVVRVGDRGARIAWHGASGVPYGFFVPQLRDVLRDSSDLILVPTASVTALQEAAESP